MNLPNRLTVSRIGLTMAMVVCLTCAAIPFGKTLALVVFVVAVLTDIWDGRIARTYSRVTAFGQLMDPQADKILISAAFIAFVAVRQIVPAWIVIIIIGREFLITGLRLLGAARGRVMAAGRWGKHKMIWQTAVILVIMFGLTLQEDLLPCLGGRHAAAATRTFAHYFSWVSLWLSALVAVLTVVSGAVYAWENRDLFMDDL